MTQNLLKRIFSTKGEETDEMDLNAPWKRDAFIVLEQRLSKKAGSKETKVLINYVLYDMQTLN